MKTLSIIGHYGIKVKNQLSGQIVKTVIITKELEKSFGEKEVLKLDTHGAKIISLLKAPFQVIKALKRANNVIIFPAHNGVKIFVPLLVFFRKFFKKRKLHYVVIGGWLPEFLKDKPKLAKKLKKFDYIYVETTTMENALVGQGFENIVVMPNCKNLKILDESELVYPNGVPYRLCTFSRVMKEKGIEDAINAVKTINEKCGRIFYTLDIYGQVDSNQTEWFENLKNDFPEYINYCGLVDADKSVEVLQDYFALLFPTRFYTEGIPGTIIDAYAAGIPVISAKWESFDDVVDGGVTGLGYEFESIDEFKAILLKIADEPKVILNMKRACIEKAKQYLPETALRVLINNLDAK